MKLVKVLTYFFTEKGLNFTLFYFYETVLYDKYPFLKQTKENGDLTWEISENKVL